MSKLTTRRAASVLSAMLYLVAFFVAQSPWLLIVLATIAAAEIFIQRSTEVGWRIFRFRVDERQEALQNEILATSYRTAIILALIGTVLIALSGAFSRPFMLAGADVVILRFGALMIAALFLLPGHVSAWMEPVAEDEVDQVANAPS